MIGHLRGGVIFKELNSIILDIQGVGYKVLAASDVLAKAHKGSPLELFIYTHVREDNISFFGFLEALDLKLFENLIGVSGIGPKTAMNIFSIGNRNQIISAIAAADTSFFKSVPRLGQKNAQKIIIELKNKFGGIAELDLSGEDMSGSEEAIAALKGFGFTSKEIYDAIRAVKKEEQKITETIKLALKYLGR
ncbi:MAG: Holliday junction ATP-dependent DNA helicase RuvA [Candidatus Levybacteria bacterium GW2011_GWA1_37_16]|nr:MAG: Holliday junction ATP-dependent DNA helicase RuvA [Candidatus Levybacteria bacterium GW2011_GWA1_37_16]KKQ37333.1 MAG: Holliday junction ATP-dependent DNA helicase RuvA [Candidatus Levybacteria bacterium GW2011_GWC2_37_7]KKQ41413.1 MAG: Holliday junction ATP-dependent DNA helicase RuvA [Candidatus Levybacteria bacterium GW2011_GWB1_37_8]